MDAVSVAAVLGGVHRKNCATMVCVFECKGVVGSIYTGKSHIKLAVGNSGTELAGGTESAVGNPETDLTALPDTLPVVEVADVAETSSDSDSFVPKLTRTRLEIWREHSNFAIGLRMAELATMWCVQGWQTTRLWAVHKLVEAACPRFDRNLEQFGHIFEWFSGFPHSGMPHWRCKFVARAAACNRHTILLVPDHRCCLDQQCQLASNNPHVHHM